MTEPEPEPEPEPDLTPVERYERERPRLLAVAFRVLGSEADAEDVLQDAWLRYAATDAAAVRNHQAWLTTVVTRLCLDQLRRRRERPRAPGTLPEGTAADGPDPSPGTGAGPAADPEATALLASDLTEAVTVVLEELTPPQRVALILHDVFGTPFDRVAEILDTTPDAAKKLASRARARVRRPGSSAATDDPAGDTVTDTDHAADRAAARRIVDAFLRAASAGDLDGLVRVLDPDVTRTADPQALPAGAALRVRGRDTVIRETAALRANAQAAHLALVDGRPGIAIGTGRALRTALVVHVAGDRIVAYDVVADPRRLALLHVEPA